MGEGGGSGCERGEGRGEEVDRCYHEDQLCADSGVPKGS